MSHKYSKEHLKFLKRYKIPEKIKSGYKIPFPNYKVDTSGLPPTSDIIGSTGTKRDPLAYKWQKGMEESPETIKELENKKKRSAPLFNKSGYGYITPETDIKTLGKK